MNADMSAHMNAAPTFEHARAVADAVMYEGYLLYPYRASSSKNQSRWQFGVLGPPGSVEAGVGEDPALASEFLVAPVGRDAAPTVAIRLRFLQLQRRSAQQAVEGGGWEEVAELVVGDTRWLSWEEAVEREVAFGPWTLDELAVGRLVQVDVPAGEEVESVDDAELSARGEFAGAPPGRLVRSRRSLHGRLQIRAHVADGQLIRLSLRVENVADGAAGDKAGAIAASFIGAHLLLGLEGAEFVSMTDPPDDAAATVAGCQQHRCWPVLAGPEGDRSLLMVSPIILYDHPELAPQSAGALFDSTEIDEILTLRVMTLTDDEKAAARATDPRAAEIIDRCDALSPEVMQQLHGILRDPHAMDRAVADAQTTELAGADLAGSFGFDDEVPWWDPAVDGSVSPESDEVLIDGVRVSAGSVVRVHPSRRADAQDLFFAGQVARVSAVHSDVDGETHVAVVLVDDPAADLHEWYGRYLYFAPDELEPLPGPAPSSASPAHREERRQ